MDLLLETVVRINRLLPRPNVGGRESEEAYSEWEYDVGRRVFLEHFGAEGLRAARLLDVGCGMGGKTVWYAESGADPVVGLDLEPRHVRQSLHFARKRNQEERVRILQGNAMQLPFGDATFSVVTANDSMEHFADPATALAELARVLEPDGHLYLYFTPWRSPLGSHLYDHVKIPWCQLLLSRRLLYGTLERSLRAEEQARGGVDADERVNARYREIVEYFENCVNGITVQRFHEIVAAEERLEPLDVHYVVPRFRFLQPLLHARPLREYLAGLVFADLQRV
jgi:ubiquinone/menaquinone biosynthesis C-methylase UbiE